MPALRRRHTVPYRGDHGRDTRLALTKHWLATSEAKLHIWDMDSGRLQKTLEEPGPRELNAVGDLLLTGDANVSSVYHLWNVATGQRLRDIELPFGTPHHQVSRYGETVVVSPSTNTAVLWQITSYGLSTQGPPLCLQVVHSDTTWRIVAGWLVVVNFNGSIMFTRLRDGHRRTYPCDAATQQPSHLFGTEDHLVIGNHRCTHVWNLEGEPHVACVLGQNPGELTAVSQSGKVLATYAADGVLSLWRLQDGTGQQIFVAQRREEEVVALLAHNKVLLSRHRGSTKLWDIERGVVRQVLPPSADARLVDGALVSIATNQCDWRPRLGPPRMSPYWLTSYGVLREPEDIAYRRRTRWLRGAYQGLTKVMGCQTEKRWAVNGQA
ncbi:MAG: WD40 repeat domain-containing protein [Deltaproteobacteria bacterium]|nr:MAG: WD40 repeat domain-containing protein [Deltaproteobacteria bacterium]